MKYLLFLPKHGFYFFFFNYFKEVNYLLPCSYGRYMYAFTPSNIEIFPSYHAQKVQDTLFTYGFHIKKQFKGM